MFRKTIYFQEHGKTVKDKKLQETISLTVSTDVCAIYCDEE
jgi:hypothetical protein